MVVAGEVVLEAGMAKLVDCAGLAQYASLVGICQEC